MSRRNFCGATLVSAVSASVPAGAKAPAGRQLAAVLFDRNVAQSRAFADHFAALGTPAFAFATDPSRLWLEHLSERMSASPLPIAGLTTQGALFCLERWSWDARMRVMMRVDHVRIEAQKWRHSPASRPDLAELEAAGASFGEAAARLIRSAAEWRDNTHAAPPRAGDEKLVSWVIAPAARP